MKCLKKGNQRSGLGGTQIFPVRWHIPAALDYLADELVFGKSQSDTVECGAALASSIVERVTVVTLLRLKNQRTLAF
jgi:hypothetical protein